MAGNAVCGLTEREIEVLGKTFLFGGYSAVELSELISGISPEKKHFAKGSVIFSPERFERELGVILSGKILVTKGRLSVSELKEGELFGAAALFNDEQTYVSTLTARTPSTVVFFSQASVMSLIDGEERIRMSYIRYLSCRIRFLSDKVDGLSEISGERKLSAFLLRHSDSEGRVLLDCSLTELAARLNISRASLYRELDKLEERGAVSRDGRRVVILKPEILSHD